MIGKDLCIVAGMLLACACDSKQTGTATLTKCLTAERARTLMAGRGQMVGLSEYEVLEQLGRPPHVLVQKRTEKSYLYPVCDSTVGVMLRFTGTGRVKELYWEGNNGQ